MKVLNVGSKQYVVHYSINSLVEMEQKTGNNFTNLFTSDVSMTKLRMLVFYGLKSKIHEFTEELAGEVMDALITDGTSFQKLSEMFMTELMAALGIKEEENPNV